ncbi:enhancer of polycomb homolog 1-like isoform X1 [Hippoglossus hippoglossus]|uniref:enhancer of polycomb homolog 1-like isoform X1 n=2 Tax=Hippoglossus hippoglossus TaxID=8267 RepID=UPI00148B8193|nr:enhancer of polycomb homolog 1-like isoform X1 [Hippoglossus hippoglossus]XP_035026430.1 enhancer of polycomb homolog 1 isoform X1 [Hippoglossus stenolepis]
MSKLSFRARALDASKPLPVFRCEDLPDLHEYASINRAVPQMPTGMEKEEESEHHLQRAISAQQVYGEKRDNMVIPVPEAESDITYYDSLYPGDYKMPKQLIHIQPFSLDTEQPDYDLDSDDEAFLIKLKKKMEISFLQFEEMIDRLEKGSGQQAVSLPEAKLLLKEDDELIKEVFDYWSRKRKNSKANSLIPNVKQERRDGSSTSDPYVAFRRRTEKMQTRKNRKNDEASYEKMLKLRRDLSRAVTILEMIKRREKSKRELLHLTLEIFEKRNVMSDFSGEVMAEVLAERALVRPQIIPLVPLTNQYRHQDHMDLKDYKSKPEKMEAPRQKRKYEKKQKALPLSSGAPHHPGPVVFNAKDLNQYDFPSSDDEPFSQLHSGSSEAEEENDPDGAYAFRRKAGCQYHSARQDRVGSWPWCDHWEGGLAEARFRYSLTTLTVPRRCLGMARRRLGRGGRALLDRAHTGYDNIFHGLNPEMLDQPLPPSPPPPTPTSRSSATDKFASTSETNTSDRSSSSFNSALSSSSPSSTDLSQILLNIKSSRWRHFRPRTLPLHELDNAHPLFRRLSRGLKRPVSASTAGGQPFGSHRLARVVPAPSPIAALTAEQYQQHQEQLALMQKQQLEQIQLQQKANSTNTANSTLGLANTLDQAKAQFAASALVTADQLLTLKTKEELGPGGGVNGVLSPSGVYKGLHLSSTVSPSPAAPAPPTTSSTPALLHPCTTTSSTSNNNGTAHPATANTATTQVLLGNNSLRLGAPAGKRVHAVRTLSTTMSTSALKFTHATANCQKPKVTTASASPLDIVPRENHEQDKPALNSLSENTVAMEVT